MVDRPIPRRGLIGCWFFDKRGPYYNEGQNTISDRSGRAGGGQFDATLKNGVTLGQSVPDRDLGAASFDPSSNQYAEAQPSGTRERAIVVLVKPESLANETFQRIAYNYDPSSNGGSFFGLAANTEQIQFNVILDDGNFVGGNAGINEDEWQVYTGSFTNQQLSIYRNDKLVASESAPTGSNESSRPYYIGSQNGSQRFFDGKIAATAKYDLTVPNAPEPSEIARSWDKLRDIPATR